MVGSKVDGVAVGLDVGEDDGDAVVGTNDDGEAVGLVGAEVGAQVLEDLDCIRRGGRKDDLGLGTESFLSGPPLFIRMCVLIVFTSSSYV